MIGARTFLVVLLFAWCAAAATAEEVAAPLPDAGAVRAPVEALYTALLDVMKRADELGFEGRYAALQPVVTESYDATFMGSRVLGRQFRSLTPEQQQQWLETFERLTVATYADRFDGFSGEQLEIDSVEPSTSGTAIVRTRILPADEKPVELDYRMRNGGSGWRIVDVYLDGTVSELALRRSEYSGLMKREGFAALTTAIEGKISAAEAGTTDGGS